MLFNFAILSFVIQLNGVRTYGSVRSLNDLIRDVSTAVSGFYKGETHSIVESLESMKK